MKSPRLLQLGDQLCDQDRLILELFKNKSVHYDGHDLIFANHLNQTGRKNNLVLIINSPFWLSELINKINSSCCEDFESCYIAINRYYLLGNDTLPNLSILPNIGETLIKLITDCLATKNFIVQKYGHKDHDHGKHFNFVQPLTWIYATNSHYQQQ